MLVLSQFPFCIHQVRSAYKARADPYSKVVSFGFKYLIVLTPDKR